MIIRRLMIFSVVIAVLCGTAFSSEMVPELQKISIDVSKTSEPISKYIYGQFIEHLGRCIYGGIWAEMLEDRKFYFPVKDEFKPWSVATDNGHWKGGDFPELTGSPWKVIGGKNTVRMIKDGSYVGDQTPEINLNNGAPGGIEQGQLALEKGRQYVGRIVLSGDAKALPIKVRLVWGDDEKDSKTITISKLSNDYAKYPFKFKAKKTTSEGCLQIIGMGNGTFKIGTVSLMPANNDDGFRPDTLKLMKELDSPVYRWPGGNFVSDYDWKDGIGDRDLRPPRKNPAWTGIEPNDVGIHEFMNLCKKLDTEPFIAVNTGMGTIEETGDEVEYCNGSTDTAMGKLRAANGHAKPYKVKWWAVGNEMYGDWQLGHMPLSDYVKKHNKCADAMRRVDPSIKLIAVGAVGEWSQTMLTECADHMALLSEHIYCKDKEDLVEHVFQLADGIKSRADSHREYRKNIDALDNKDIRIAMDEWNYWYGQYRYGELGVRYYLQDALGVAVGLHEYYRNSDMYFMANYAQTVNVIGAIKTNKTEAAFATTGLALKLYRNHYGEIPVEVSGFSRPIDIAAALTSNSKSITVSVVNPTQKAVAISLDVNGAVLSKKAVMRYISGDDKLDYNQPGQDADVVIKKIKIKNCIEPITISPISACLIELSVVKK